MFVGFAQLGNTLRDWLVTKDADGQPVVPDAAPKFTVHGPSGLLASAGGTASAARTATNVTGATNASPIVLTTSAAHGLVTGQRVTIASVGGNTAANGTFVATVLSDTTFSLDGSTGNGSYTSGGSWTLTGHYRADIVCSGGNNFEAGEHYTAVHTWKVSGESRSETHEFGVT